MPRNLDFNKARTLIRQFNYSNLFIQHMGWDNPNMGNVNIDLGDEIFTFSPIARKRFLVVFECMGSAIPNRATQKRLHAKLRKYSIENFIIFHTEEPSTQEWFFVWRDPGQTMRAHIYKVNEDLLQRLQAITFSLQEEEALSPIEVLSKFRQSFDVERVTRRFYDQFKKEHSNLMKFISGIPDEDMKSWYTSVILNRLMFVYFIEKKGFLNNDINYLRNQLSAIKDQKSNAFYKEFLCPLFFEGFALQENERSKKINELLGTIPYLNGGIFQKHQIEELHGDSIEIPDKVFHRLFNFFDQFRWHLDDRPTGAENEINPDVLGYIFEKYINQKQMGAYYTKEDITGYISRNTIIPWLFIKAKNHCINAFDGEQSVWKMLKEEPERFIYPSVRKGVTLELPEYISEGLHDVKHRTRWNTPSDDSYGLPTEIWRETIERRQRYHDVKQKLIRGEISDINDFITYNLDIELFAQDVIQNTEIPELVRAFWKMLTSIKILDPTVGSGAFLFAAMNILARLYEDCLEQMEHFVESLTEESHPEKFSDFKQIIARMKTHTSRQYFIYKTITINNLYGVDIMEEAVETCKLRLFLKLVSQIETRSDLEPLPDIDFNIRAGNSLVGFTSLEDAAKALKKSRTTVKGDQVATQNPLIMLPEETNQLRRIQEDAKLVNQAYVRFQQMQTTQGMKSDDFREAKVTLAGYLDNLNDELNRAMALSFGIPINSAKSYKQWLQNHKPFNWCIDFYETIQNKGFDVIIGNPPYVRYSQVRSTYTIKGFKTQRTGNLYAFVIERALSLINPRGYFSMIVPIASVSTGGMKELQNIYKPYKQWHSHYAVRPGKLFSGVDMNLTISILKQSKDCQIFSTRYQRWYESEEREFLFDQIRYIRIINFIKHENIYPKYGSNIENVILEKIKITGLTLSQYYSKYGAKVYYHSGGRYWRKAIKEQLSSHYKEITLQPQHENIVIAILNSQLFYWYWITHSNCMDVVSREVDNFPIFSFSDKDFSKYKPIIEILMTSYYENARKVVRRGDIIRTTEYNFDIGKSKEIIDQVDAKLAKDYELSENELDFIINYDIKYRMGDNLNE